MSEERSNDGKRHTPVSLKKFINKGNIKLVWQSIRTEGLKSTFSKIKKTVNKQNDDSEKLLKFKSLNSDTIVFKYHQKPRATIVLIGMEREDYSIVYEINKNLDDVPIEIFIVKPNDGFIVSECIKGIKTVNKQNDGWMSTILKKSRCDRYVIANTKIITVEIINDIIKNIDTEDTGSVNNKAMTVYEIEEHCNNGNMLSIGKEQIILN